MSNPQAPCQKRFDVGGQAVIEGVMMRGPRGFVTAVRLPSTGEITTQEIPYQPIAKRFKPASWPFFRGAIALVEMMVIGIKSLTWAGNMVADDEDKAEKTRQEAAGETIKPSRAKPFFWIAATVLLLCVIGIFTQRPVEGEPTSLAFWISLGVGLVSAVVSFLAAATLSGETDEHGALTKLALILTMVVSLGFAMALFVAIPNLLTHCISNFAEVSSKASEIGWGAALWMLALNPKELGFQEYDQPLGYNVIAAFVRISLFLSYIWAISRIKEVGRVFQYHGAEHMAIKTYEAEEPLEVEYARTKTTPHPRCGTTFIAVTMLIAIVVFSILTKVMVAVWPELREMNWWAFKGIMICTHILFMPLVAGIGYEIIKQAGKRPDHFLMRPIIWPGLKFQKLTTRHPDDSMLEVALVSLKEALALVDEDDNKSADEASGAIY